MSPGPFFLYLNGKTYYCWPVQGSGYCGRVMTGELTVDGVRHFFAADGSMVW